MIKIKDHKQLTLFDEWAFLSPKRRRNLNEGWPGMFREQLLLELPVNEICPYFRQGKGRPSKELYTILGMLVFQQVMDLNDVETSEQLGYNIQWHYALNITEESDEAKYVSEKTLWSMRQLVIRLGLDAVIFDNISQKLAKVFDVNTDNQRLDSVHIKSNMRRLGRISIFARTIRSFLINLKRRLPEPFNTIAPAVIERYLPVKALAAFALIKPSESEKTLATLSTDLFDLIEQFKDQPAVYNMHTYKLMQRVLREQCNVQSDGATRSVHVKKPKHVSSDSLQNPSDPDASYCGHKGQGFQVQVMETFTKSDDPHQKEQTLNLITHVQVQKACEHDTHALMPAIEATQQKGLGPKSVVADTHYGSTDNVDTAQAAQVELIAPTSKGGNSDLGGFAFEASGRVSACPAGNGPLKVKCKKDRFTASFCQDHCGSCPFAQQCPVDHGKKNNYLRYSHKDFRLALRRAAMHQQQFIDAYRWRAGVEATMSQYDRCTGVKHLRVRGFDAVRFYATLKAVGLNILRAVAVRKARKRAQNGPSGGPSTGFWPLIMPFPFFKERFYCFLSGLERILLPGPCVAGTHGFLAA
jgi:hypothetical protein